MDFAQDAEKLRAQNDEMHINAHEKRQAKRAKKRTSVRMKQPTLSE